MTKLIDILDNEIHVQGRTLRIAQSHGDRYRFLDDPRPVIDELRESGRTGGFVHFRPKAYQTVSRNSPTWLNGTILPCCPYRRLRIGGQSKLDSRPGTKRSRQRRTVSWCGRCLSTTRWLPGSMKSTMNARSGRDGAFPHYGKNFETVRREEATFLDSSIFIGAFFRG